MDDAFQWVIDNEGIATEETYPYVSSTGEAGVCNTKLVSNPPFLFCNFHTSFSVLIIYKMDVQRFFGFYLSDSVLLGQQLLEKSVTIDEYVDVEPYNEEALMAAVAKQPVSVAIEASAYDFQLYSEVCKQQFHLDSLLPWSS